MSNLTSQLKREQIIAYILDEADSHVDGTPGDADYITIVCLELAADTHRAALARFARETGIPISVISGETKLTDHFSQEYIDLQRNKKS